MMCLSVLLTQSFHRCLSPVLNELCGLAILFGSSECHQLPWLDRSRKDECCVS